VAAQASCRRRQPAGSRRPALHVHATTAKSARTTNAIERLHEEFKRRISRGGKFTAFDHDRIVAEAREAADQLREKAKWPT
jgi:transposase-like protein